METKPQGAELPSYLKDLKVKLSHIDPDHAAIVLESINRLDTEVSANLLNIAAALPGGELEAVKIFARMVNAKTTQRNGAPIHALEVVQESPRIEDRYS